MKTRKKQDGYKALAKTALVSDFIMKNVSDSRRRKAVVKVVPPIASNKNATRSPVGTQKPA